MKKLISNWFEFIFGLKLKNKRTYFIEEKPNIRTTYPNL
jgi:hypothetical protein